MRELLYLSFYDEDKLLRLFADESKLIKILLLPLTRQAAMASFYVKVGVN